MNKKYTASILSLLCIGALSSYAQTIPAAASSSSWVVTPTVVSQYMFRGVRLGGPAFQPSVEFDSGAIAVGLWANMPIKDKVGGQSDPEIDIYGSYNYTLIKDKLTLQPGITFYTYPDAKKKNGFYKFTYEPNIALTYTIGDFKLTPKIYDDLVLDGFTYEFNAAWTAYKDETTEINLTGSIGTFEWKDCIEQSDPKAKNWGSYWSLGVSMPVAVSKNSKIIVGWSYQNGSDNYIKVGNLGRTENKAAVARGVTTLAYSVTF